jgi:beta-galactosidase
MEAYDQSRGGTVYRTVVPAGPAGVLNVRAVHDFAWAFLDGSPVGIMDRRSGRYRIDLPARTAPAQLDLLVYAMGRINFGEQVFDRKGLHGPVEFEDHKLTAWEVFPLPLDSPMLAGLQYGPAVLNGPAFWRGGFELAQAGDTFLDMRMWGKGVVWINGRCLGRFWNIGPQQTLYVPGPWLRAGRNEVVVLDILGPQAPRLAGIAKPILDQIRPELDFARLNRAKGTFAPTEPVAVGAFTEEGRWQEVTFSRTICGRYLSLEALSAFDGGPSAAVGGLDAFDGDGLPLPRAGWKVLWTSSEERNYLPGEAENVLDGQTASYWHSQAGVNALPPPHRLVLDLGETREIGGIRYLPRAGGADASGRVQDYRVYVANVPFGLELTP